jgi:hypothetical protein
MILKLSKPLFTFRPLVRFYSLPAASGHQANPFILGQMNDDKDLNKAIESFLKSRKKIPLSEEIEILNQLRLQVDKNKDLKNIVRNND